MIYSRFILIWLICALFPGDLISQIYTERFEHSFKLSAQREVEVLNKYGMIHVETWEKDSVGITIDLRIESSTQEKLDKQKESIAFDVVSSKYKIQARTLFVKARGLITGFTDAFMPTTRVHIDYTVSIPEDMSITIENKYGDIYLDDLSGKVNITLGQGILTANNLNGTVNLNLSNADAEIDYINSGTVSVALGDFNLIKTNTLNLNTRSSKINIEKADLLNIQSRSDKYKIDNSEKLVCSGTVTTLKVSNIDNELNAALKYGGVEIDNIDNSFKFINLESEYADIDLFFERGSSYNLDVTHHEDVRLMFPNQHAKIETKKIDEDEKLYLTYGSIGTKVTASSPKLKISALKKCVVNIIHK